MLEPHLHLASGIGFILHIAMIRGRRVDENPRKVIKFMVIPILWSSCSSYLITFALILHIKYETPIFFWEDYDIVDNFLFLFLADGINVSWCILMLNLKLKWGSV